MNKRYQELGRVTRLESDDPANQDLDSFARKRIEVLKERIESGESNAKLQERLSIYEELLEDEGN